ncbi:MAG: FtsW/RodA/SpoVE family cell cycle protein [Pirellulales bacterium]|nr:FtsW/RodA/SpoVE family cell cycle protein [Pirellulales bacterium]
MTFSVWRKHLCFSILIPAVLLVGLGWLGIARYGVIAGLSHGLLHRQIAWSLLGVIAMLAATLPNYRVFARWSYGLFALALLLLVAVYFFPQINRARRWIRVGPIGLQPSEFAKVAYVMALACWLMYRENQRRLHGLLVPLLLTLVPVLLILREPDLGTALVFLPVFFAVVFTAGARWRDLLILAMLGALTVPLMWSQMSGEQRSRVRAWFHQTTPEQTPNDDTRHLHQAKQMLALGGVWGSWIGGQTVEDPAAYRLPEARSDFIFCVLGERYGWPGIAATLGLFGFLVWRGLVIAARTREPYGRLLVAGVMALFAVEVLINTGMTVGVLPITGLSLPLVSYGGSGLMAHLVMLGLVMNVAMRPGYEMGKEPFRFVEKR